MDFLNSTKQSLHLYVYGVGDYAVRDTLIDLHKADVDVKLLVSSTSLGSEKLSGTSQIYDELVSAGVPVKTSLKCFRFAHQKYWLIDGDTLGLGAW